MSQKKDFRPVYKRLLGHCQPYSHHGPWQELPVFSGICRPSTDATAVLTDLQQQFSQADLLEAGVVIMDEAVEVQLEPVLCDHDTVVIPLIETAKDDPFEVLTDQGTLSGRQLPICASLVDGRVRKLIEASRKKIMFVATTAADAAILLSLKIPATLATGLAELGGVYLQQFQECVDLFPPQPPQFFGISYHEEAEEERTRRPLELMLVGCSLAEMSQETPNGVSAIASHLADVERYLDIDLDQCSLWKPAAQEIKAIEFGTKYAGPQAVRDAIIESIDLSAKPLIVRPRSNVMPQDLPAAIQEFAKEISSHDRTRGTDWEKRAWANILRLIEETGVASMFRAAEATDDPAEKNLWMMAATNGQVMYPQAMQMLFKAVRDAQEKGPGQVGTLRKEAFQQQMQRNDRQLKIFKEIRECRKHPYRTWKKMGS